MANRYVYSGAGGAGTGADWANAFTTLVLACAADTAGDIFWVAHDHAESTAGNITPSFAGTTGTPSLIYCVDRAGSVPPVAADLRTTATVTTTGGTSIITLGGSLYCYGIIFSSATGASGGQFVLSNGFDNQHFENCSFALAATGSAVIQTGSTTNNSKVEFQGCTFTFAAVNQGFSLFGPTIFKNCTFGGSAIPNDLFATSVQTSMLRLEGCDLSALGSGKALLHDGGSANRLQTLFLNCKLGASVTIGPTPGTATYIGQITDVVNCDSGDTNYRTERWMREGKLTTEITIVRTGGASDGTTPIAWKIETSAEAEIFQPFEAPAIAIWNETTGSAVTATIEGIWGGGAVPDNNDIWIEAQYLGTSGFPISSRLNGGVATPLHTATSHAASSETWGGSTTDFHMAVTFTPQEKGFIYIYVRAGLASTTFYVDPKITLT